MDYPDTFYHVLSRGNERRNIFRDAQAVTFLTRNCNVFSKYFHVFIYVFFAIYHKMWHEFYWQIISKA